jgi:cell division septation protein DedD
MGMSKGEFTTKFVKIGLAAAISIALAACAEGNGPSLFKGNGEGSGIFKKKNDGGGLFGKKKTTTSKPAKDGTIKLVERDVESPEVFQVTEKALWDGRPSLGGVWVAHPDSKQPERVIIRNQSNGKFVIGALFKRERDNPGPRVQLSSDAANALGVLAGSPTTLNVTALRRETVNATDGGGSPATPESVVTETLAPSATSTEDIESNVLKSVANAEAGTTKTIDIPAKKPSATPKAETPQVKTTSAGSNLGQPFIQLGFFSVEKNARNTLKSLETRRIPGKVVKASAKGKAFWRVLAGPAQTKGERDAYLKEIKKMGFADAYLTKN